MNWNYHTRRIIALILSIIIGLVFITFGIFLNQQANTDGKFIVFLGVILIAIFAMRYLFIKNTNK